MKHETGLFLLHQRLTQTEYALCLSLMNSRVRGSREMQYVMRHGAVLYLLLK